MWQVINELDSEEIVKYGYAQRKTPLTERLNQASLSFMVYVGRREYRDFPTFD
jgi:hypothetical protein